MNITNSTANILTVSLPGDSSAPILSIPPGMIGSWNLTNLPTVSSGGASTSLPSTSVTGYVIAGTGDTNTLHIASFETSHPDTDLMFWGGFLLPLIVAFPVAILQWFRRLANSAVD